MITDPIADLLTRIRNGQKAGHREVSIPSSKLKKNVLNALTGEGFIQGFSENVEGKFPKLEISLKYLKNGLPVIRRIQRVSRPGKRVYMGKEDLAKTKNISVVKVLSTSRGVMSDIKAQEVGVGGEVICSVE